MRRNINCWFYHDIPSNNQYQLTVLFSTNQIRNKEYNDEIYLPLNLLSVLLLKHSYLQGILLQTV